MRRFAAPLALLALVAVLAGGCGVKGDPEPPIDTTAASGS